MCKMYGKSAVLNGSTPTKIIESAALLKLHQQTPVQITNGSSAAMVAVTNGIHNNKQVGWCCQDGLLSPEA